jgi:broad specificity phosphatase PhoE
MPKRIGVPTDASETLDAIFSSDLSRAQETALLCAEPHGLPVRAEPRLRELDFGQWEGKTFTETYRMGGESAVAWYRGGLESRPPEGESLASLADRVGAFFQEIVRARHRAALVVAHRGSLRVLLCLALGLTPLMHWRFHLNPASISRLALLPEGGAVLTCLNDTHHLHEVEHAG